MLTRRGAAALVSAGVLVFSAPVFAQGRGNQAPVDQKKLTDAQKKEMGAIDAMVDGDMAGQPVPNDLSLAWVHDDLLKATGNREYVPFTVSIDPAKLTGTNLTIYWRVVSKEQPGAMAAPPNGKKDDKNSKNGPRPTFAWEDMGGMTTTASASQTGPLKLSRSFTVPAGSYDVYVVVKEPSPDKKNAPPAKTSVIKQTVNVADLWNDELNTSSIIVAERIDPLPAPLTPQQMIERPYALGSMEIVPAAANKFTKKAELQPFLLIYNAKTDSANKPDVTVEFNFYSKDAGGEKFFNKTKPQELNAQTLPPQFDFAAGHQLQSGQAVPLASFPEGDYRLEIIVTDKIANKTVKRDVIFSVSGS
jgi:hypothetical protein